MDPPRQTCPHRRVKVILRYLNSARERLYRGLDLRSLKHFVFHRFYTYSAQHVRGTRPQHTLQTMPLPPQTSSVCAKLEPQPYSHFPNRPRRFSMHKRKSESPPAPQCARKPSPGAIAPSTAAPEPPRRPNMHKRNSESPPALTHAETHLQIASCYSRSPPAFKHA